VTAGRAGASRTAAASTSRPADPAGASRPADRAGVARPALVRLAIRVPAIAAEVALARLLPVLRAGAEERCDGEWVEYSLYGAPNVLPDEPELRALAGDDLLEVSVEPVADGWETAWHAHLTRVTAGALAVRPPWVAGEPDDLVIDPGTAFGAGTHATTRIVRSRTLSK
jgi:ribosomal protein L11 methyltransferase